MQPDIVICVEHVSRELSIASLVSKLAEEHCGIRVAVMSLLTPVKLWPKDWNPAVICFPYLYSRDDFAVDAVLASYPKSSIVNLAYEQHLSRANKAFKCPRDDFARTQVTHLASGASFRRYLLESGVPDSCIKVIGNLPCTLYQEPYCNRFADQKAILAKKHDLPFDKPWLLFPENFAAAFFRRSHKRKRLQLGFSKADLNDYVQSSRSCFESSMRWLAKLPVTDDYQIIIRPRPAFNEDFFRDQVRRAIGRPLDQSIRLIKDGDVRPWILASDSVISGISSTLVEAAAAGKIIGTIEPTPLPPSVRSDWTEHAPTICCFADLQRLVDHMIEAHHSIGSAELLGGALDQTSIRSWVQDEMLGQRDSFHCCVEFLYQRVQSVRSRERTTPAPRVTHQSRTGKTATQLMKRVGKSIGRLNPFKNEKIFGHQHDTITTEMIVGERRQWEEALGPRLRERDAA